MYCHFAWVFVLFGYVNSARILCVLTIPSYSHQVVYQRLWMELARQGHDMVVMTPNPPKSNESIPNVRIIDWSETYRVHEDFMKSLTSPPKGLIYYNKLWSLTDTMYEQELSHREVQQLIKNETEHFDLLIMEWFYPTMTAFKDRFNCPMIGITSMPTNVFSFDAIGQPSHPVYNPDFVIRAAKNLNVLQRIKSAFFAGWFRFVYRYFVVPYVDGMVKRHFGANMRSVYEIERDISLLFVNTNYAINPARPNVPTVVNINGLHIKQNKPLPKDLQKYLDEATEGVVYFSFGSNLGSSSVSPEQFNVIIDAFSELPYKILWKWNGDEFPNKHANIRLAKWLPQQDILAHHNVKSFITHGGVQSLEEAIHFKTPIVGVAFNGDQYQNIHMMVLHGLGVMVDFEALTKKSLKNAIIKVMSDKMYKKNMENMYTMVADQPMKPLNLATWWVEYILRHKGASHLRSPLADTPWYQYYLLDVISLIFATVFATCVILRKSMLFVIWLCKSNATNAPRSNKELPKQHPEGQRRPKHD